MRKVLIYIIGLVFVSCAEMHDPILHSGGYIKFIPELVQETDSVALKRMSKYFKYTWDEKIFCKDLIDFHVCWYNTSSYDIDFIKESHELRTPYGIYQVIWNTNPYNNNIQNRNRIYTEHLNDTICKIPDFVYSSHNSIDVCDLRGNKTVQLFKRKLEQRSFLYIVQVSLKNNNNTVKQSGTFMITGLSEGFDIITDETFGNICYVFNTNLKQDIITGSFMSFGIPNYNPYEVRYNTRHNKGSYENKNLLYIQLQYSSKRRIIEVDVSKQVLLQPTGGLILVELDVNDYPEPEEDIKDPFNVLVDDYENTDQYFTNF